MMTYSDIQYQEAAKLDANVCPATDQAYFETAIPNVVDSLWTQNV